MTSDTKKNVVIICKVVWTLLFIFGWGFLTILGLALLQFHMAAPGKLSCCLILISLGVFLLNMALCAGRKRLLIVSLVFILLGLLGGGGVLFLDSSCSQQVISGN